MNFPDLFDAGLAVGQLIALAASTAMVGVTPSANAEGSNPASVVGRYDGGQMEVAADLELAADGRFRYGLSYGALDEQATGKWSLSGDRVTLTSDPVTAPRFVVVSQEKGPEGVLRITLDFKDRQFLQYFDAVITTSAGSVEQAQLGTDGLTWPFHAGAPPKSVRLLFGVYQLVSDPLPLAPGPGYLIQYHFEQNDLGKVDFKGEPVRIVHGELLLERHGLKLSFKRGNP